MNSLKILRFLHPGKIIEWIFERETEMFQAQFHQYNILRKVFFFRKKKY